MATLCIQERTIGAKMGQWMHSLITNTIKMVYFWVSFERYHCLDDQCENNSFLRKHSFRAGNFRGKFNKESKGSLFECISNLCYN